LIRAEAPRQLPAANQKMKSADGTVTEIDRRKSFVKGGQQ
jgi:hypothetical protein